MFDFKRVTLFCLEIHLSKQKRTIFSKNFGGHGPFRPPWLRLWVERLNFEQLVYEFVCEELFLARLHKKITHAKSRD